jgi:hypothetical protein
MKAKSVLAAIVLTGGLWVSCSLPAQAAEIYRWIDENGRTQVSDAVPEQYEKAATKIDTRKFEATTEQRRDAEARAEREQYKVAELERRRDAAAKVVSQTLPPVASGSGSTQLSGNNDIDCPILWRQYKESADCFAPYRNVNGSVKAEAYSRCTSIPSPSPRCGPAPHGWATP